MQHHFPANFLRGQRIKNEIGYDVCEYPDSNKLFIAPTYEIFDKNAQLNYFDGEENIQDKWEQIENKKNDANLQHTD